MASKRTKHKYTTSTSMMQYPAFSGPSSLHSFLGSSDFLTTGANSKCQLPVRKLQPYRQEMPTMLRVQKKKQPEDWEKRLSTLSGRFLPMDPRDENILNILENGNPRSVSVEDTYGPEGPPTKAYGESGAPSQPREWSKRSEAARKRWADLAYRAKMLEKRAEKRRLDEEAEAEQPKHKVEIGPVDSITMCNEDRAKAINDYARSNKLRSEKVTAFHRDRNRWMEERLSTGGNKLTDEEYVKMKKEIQQKRREIALKRAQKKREKEAVEQKKEGNI